MECGDVGAKVSKATDADHAAGVTEEGGNYGQTDQKSEEKGSVMELLCLKKNFSLALWFIKAFRHRIVKSRQITHTARMDWTKKSKKM